MKPSLALLVFTSVALASLLLWSFTAVKIGRFWIPNQVGQRTSQISCNQARSTNATTIDQKASSTKNSSPAEAELDKRQPKVLCFVLTTSSVANEEKRSAVRETWGKRCDKLLFVEKGSRLAEINGVLRVPVVEESRKELWHKVLKAFTHVYRRYLDDFDWFMKADDDTYLIVERLKQFLSERSSPDKPIYFGHKFKPYVNQGYMSGGSGYVLSRQALKLLVEEGINLRKAECHLDGHQPEDVGMGECLESVGVKAGDSRDSQGRPTFLPLTPDNLISSEQVDKNSWYYSYDFYGPPKPGKDCCSDKPISFHYIQPNKMRLIDWLLYDVKGINNNNQEQGD